MEHFEADEQLLILREFHRVLKPGGKVLLWWPPLHGLDQLALRPFGKLFPGEPGRLSSADVRTLVSGAEFHNVHISLPLNDFLTELVVRGEKR